MTTPIPELVEEKKKEKEPSLLDVACVSLLALLAVAAACFATGVCVGLVYIGFVFVARML